MKLPFTASPLANRRKKTANKTAIQLLVCFLTMTTQLTGSACHAIGTLKLQFVDEETEQQIPVRMSLFRSSGKPAPIRRGTHATVGSAIDGAIELRLPPDTYRFVISRGPEYREVQGTVVVTDNAEELKTVRVPRILSMLSEGWISGELAAEIPIEDTDLRSRADDLKVVGIVEAEQPQATKKALSDSPEPAPTPAIAVVPPMARRDLMRGTGNASDLLFIGQHQTELLQADSNAPSCEFIHAVKLTKDSESITKLIGDRSIGDRSIGDSDELSGVTRDSGRLVILNPMAKDLPLWLATEKTDGIVVLGEYLRIDSKTLTWPNSFAPNRLEMTGPHALGLWSVAIYEQMLEAGLRIPPIGTAGTGFQPNPLGYTRTYVFAEPTARTWPSDCDAQPIDKQTYKQLGGVWWDGLWQGRSMVTGGPLLRPMLDDQPPGHTFYASSGESLRLTLTLKLTIRDPVDYLEVIQDGRIVYKARLEEYARQAGRIPPLEFDSSGWVMVRIMTKYADHYQAAFSAPWFVHFEGQPRISGKAVEFFQGLLKQREEELARLPREKISAHAPHVRAARAFWARQSEMVNAP